MQKPFDHAADDKRIVYVKAVDVNQLPDEIQTQLDGTDQLYAVHASDGQQLALVADRRLAFRIARQNDYAPVPVH